MRRPMDISAPCTGSTGFPFSCLSSGCSLSSTGFSLKNTDQEIYTAMANVVQADGGFEPLEFGRIWPNAPVRNPSNTQ